ncbi:Wzt carbohydrate-binding domain-containing protein [Paenibacillus sp. P26]|nr:Wzt carbohydrate-binding domain-containing protein [Paenibacillus sp. P26]
MLFKKKCISKIEEFKRLGKTIVFVSHDNGTMERLCDEVYWIHESKVKQSGDPREVIRDYMDFLTLTEEERMNREIQNQEIESKQEQIQEGQSEKTADQSEKRWGNKKIEIKNILLKDANGDMKNIFGKGTPMTVEIKYDVNNQEDIDQTAFGFGIFKNDGTHCYGTNTFIDKQNLHLTDSGILNVEISSLNLTEGKYFLDIACHHIDGTPYDYIKQAAVFHINSYENDRGVAYIPHKWILKEK